VVINHEHSLAVPGNNPGQVVHTHASVTRQLQCKWICVLS